VLLAEDDTEMRRALAWALEKDGFDVFEFRDGSKLDDYLIDFILADVDADIADIVISDIRMPGASGLEILEAIRTLDAAMPVILITAFGDRKTHEEAAELNARVLDKPFDTAELLATVREALDRRPYAPAPGPAPHTS
jgi:DNA-binding response OmpR family regulator